MTPPTVLFLCVHNAGRSQMAAAFLRAIGGRRVRVRSAGSEPASNLNPRVIEAMAEFGIDIRRRKPRRLTDSDAVEADVVVTMGCGDACPVFPGKRYIDWQLDDPAVLDLAGVRRVRDEIRARVEHLAVELRVMSRGR